MKTLLFNHLNKIALYLAFHCWLFATKRNPDLGYAYLNGVYKASFRKETETTSQPKPEPKQAC